MPCRLGCRTSAVFAALVWMLVSPAPAADRPAPQPGRTFQSPDTQKLEADDAANAGFLWIERGAALWGKADSGARSCADCHAVAEASMKGVAARYPVVDAKSGQLLNMEGRINQCRTERQGLPALAYDSDALLALTAFVTLQSKGMARNIAINGAAQSFFARGKSFYETRQGQLNLACGQCHDDNIGRKLRGDRISQGQTDGWPAYRLEWQTVGSLHRRLRACSLGVRADILDAGSPEYLALELYLAWRGETLPVAAPGVRR
jgi:L-cysteine S-thiosulfotransferase